MKKDYSARVTVVRKSADNNKKSKINPAVDYRAQDEGNSVPSSSLIYIQPRTTSTYSKNRNIFVTDSSSFDVIGQAVKYTSQDIRKKKKVCSKAGIISLVALLILILIAVAIFLIIYFTTQTPTKTTLSYSNAILRWNSSGITVAGVSGSSGSNATHLNSPTDVVLDLSNTMYISDYQNNRIQKWMMGKSSGTTVAGQANTGYGSTLADLYFPSGLYMDANNNLYIADMENNRIQLWNNGALIGSRVAGTGLNGTALNELNRPSNVVQDSDTKALYIADYDNHRVMKYASGASIGSIVAGGNGSGISNIQLFNPVGLHFDSFSNSLIISNFKAHNIVRWVSGDSKWTLLAGSLNGTFGTSTSMLRRPSGLTLDPMGNIYVSDTANCRIQLFLSGKTEAITIAGIVNLPGTNSTQLNSPYAVRLDNQLNLYVVDSANHRIQKFLRY